MLLYVYACTRGYTCTTWYIRDGKKLRTYNVHNILREQSVVEQQQHTTTDATSTINSTCWVRTQHAAAAVLVYVQQQQGTT